MSFHKHRDEEWQDNEQLADAEHRELYVKKWWEKWILENKKLHYFVLILLFLILVFLVGYFSGLWFHVGSLFVLLFFLVLVEIMRIRRNMYYIVESRLAGDVITTPDGKKLIVNETATSLIEIPKFAYPDWRHIGTNGAPLPVQTSRVIFADYVDTENQIIYHSPDMEFANVVLSAGVNSDIIASRTAELREVPEEMIDKTLKNLRNLKSALEKRKEQNPDSAKLWNPLIHMIDGKLAEIEEIKKIVELDETVLLSKEFAHTYRITPSVKRNLFLHYKNTIPDLRSALFLLQNNLREFADAVSSAKMYAALGKTMPLDVRRRLADVFEKLGYDDIFSLDEKKEVKEHVVKE